MKYFEEILVFGAGGVLLLLLLFLAYNSHSQCSKKFCPKDMKPGLVRDAGCICLIEAK